MVALNDVQLILICFLLGAIFKFLAPYLIKWQESGYVLKFNPAFFINFISNIVIVIFVGLFDFSVWVIPVEALWIACFSAFFTAAGLDSFIKKLVDLLGIRDAILLKTRGVPT